MKKRKKTTVTVGSKKAKRKKLKFKKPTEEEMVNGMIGGDILGMVLEMVASILKS